MSDADPRCPECGEPIGQTATYCMHCSAELTDEREAADTDPDGTWAESTTDDGAAEWGSSGSDDAEPTYGPGGDGEGTDLASAMADPDEQLLDPDGLVDNSLTVVVGIAGGLVVGVVGTTALLVMTGSAWGFLVGVLAWLGATAYLVRRRTVQGAVAKSGYAVAAVLLLLPLVAFSPLADVEGGLTGRVTFFLASLLAVGIPAGIAAGLGYVAAQFVPEDAGKTST